MRRLTPEQQLRVELHRLPAKDRNFLCIAIICYLRFGITGALRQFLNH